MLNGKSYLIHDRDPLFTAEFLNMLAATGVKSVKLPPRSPNLNAHAERFVRTIKESCLDRMILFGDDSLRTAIQNFIAHYEVGHLAKIGAIQRRERRSGMLNYYYRRAA
jgi:putative transposase